MPTYEYECRSCGHNFEAFQSMQDDSLTTCPDCGQEHLRRIISGGAGIIFKGSGFYVNDSRNSSSTTKSSSSGSNSNKAESSKSEEIKTPKKSDTTKADTSNAGSSGNSSKASA
ncbi:MAG: zinc ribbon domain-containing protein [Spirochaetaceae bacterium]|nr:zinc ribbon domain-containing protein [Spirochaetaceae bacterium]